MSVSNKQAKVFSNAKNNVRKLFEIMWKQRDLQCGLLDQAVLATNNMSDIVKRKKQILIDMHIIYIKCLIISKMLMSLKNHY